MVEITDSAERGGQAGAAPSTRPSRRALSVGPSSWFGAHELPQGVQSRPYEEQTFTASGGTPPYRFRVVKGISALLDVTKRLPEGLGLSEDGVLGGTPTRGGGYRFAIEATDAEGRTGTSEYTLAVRLDLDRFAARFDDGSERRITDFDPAFDGDSLPLTLCEFLAFKSAQAYLGDDPLRPKRHLRTVLDQAHPDGAIRNFAFFDSTVPLVPQGEGVDPLLQAPDHWRDIAPREIRRLNATRKALDAQAFGFVFEGRTFIVCRGTTSIADWRVDIDNGLTTEPERGNSWVEALQYRVALRSKRMNMTDEERILIGGPDPATYLKPARSVGFAAAWAALRDPIENWIETLPMEARQEFVFSGHSLGGALAFVGAQEFAEKRGRRIHAVVTFGAPCVGMSARDTERMAQTKAPGRKDAKRAAAQALAAAEDSMDSSEVHFVENYRRLQGGDLEKRTIRLETVGDAVPKLMQVKRFSHVGRGWEIEFPPLPSPTTLFTRRFLSGPLLWLARAGLSGAPKSISAVPRKALGYVVFYGIPFLNSAMAAHGAYARYALFLSTLSYRKLRQGAVGDLGDLADSDAEIPDELYREANDRLDAHLAAVYAPAALRKASPRLISDARQERRLARRYYGARRATYLF